MPSKITHPPSAEAKWCIEQLFTHMELGLKNRVQAKTGRGRSLELTKLSNLMSNAGLAHQSKPRTPVSPNRVRRLESSVTIAPEQRSALREVYIYYCSWAEKHNYLFMSRSQFLRFARDTYLMSGDMDATALMLLFEKIHVESPDESPGMRFSMADWLQALIVIASRTYSHMQPQQAWDKVINDHVQPFAGRSITANDRLSPVMLQSDVVEALADAKAKLRPVYDFYVQQQDFGGPTKEKKPGSAGSTLTGPLQAGPRAESPPSPHRHLPPITGGEEHDVPVAATLVAGRESSSGAGGAQTLDRQWQLGVSVGVPPATAASAGSSKFAGLQVARSQMPLATFLQFLHDFDVMPQLVNKAAATGAFRAARFGPGHDDSEGADLMRIDFEEFMDAVGRVALIGFNYQPKVEPPKLMVFQEGYHTGAKHLWTAESRADAHASLLLPDEVDVPAAELESAIGNEDTAHFDRLLPTRGGGATSARSMARSKAGAIFRSARSLAQYKTKVSLHGGPGGEGRSVEVMAIHGDGDALVDTRPHHLRDYKPEWIGRPGMPLNETAMLKIHKPWPSANGVYNGLEAGLPPVFKERAEQMIDARVAREQTMEALRLVYVAQRREQMRQQQYSTAARRQQLQSLSRQQLTAQQQLTLTQLHEC